MINPDINRFLGTFLYPITDPKLLFDDPFDLFFSQLPHGFIAPGSEKTLKENKETAVAAAIGYIARRYSLDSYDQISQYMERWYLGRAAWRFKENVLEESPSLYNMVFYRLKQLSRSMISKLDGQIIYKYWKTEEDTSLLGGFAGNDKIHLFRGLNQIIPLDLLAAIFVMDNPDARAALNSFYGQVAITDVPLEKILDRGVAENHLHINAATGFSVIWEDLMRPNISLDRQERRLPLKSPDAQSKSMLYLYWMMARSLRMYLAAYVPAPAGVCSGMNTGDSIIQRLFPGNLKILYKFLCGNSEETDRTLEYFQPVERFLSAVVMDKPSSPLQPENPLQLTEPHFLCQMFTDFLKSPNSSREFQKKLFLQYLRIKHTIFHLMVPDKTIFGLDHFQRYYASSAGLNRTVASFGRHISRSNDEFLERQIRSQLSTPHIRCLEFRMSFPDKIGKARKSLSQFLKAYRKILWNDYCVFNPNSETYRPVRPFPRGGIVFHFLKSVQEMPDVCFCSDDGAMRTYSELHKRYQIQLKIFKDLRDPLRYPGIDRYLVGIDVASLENSVPTWVFRDIYESTRDAKSEPFILTGKRPFQSLGFTFHAGEDFRHMLSGLRRIYEVIHYLKFHAGDRIGHGLALGISVGDWCAEHPNVLLPRIEALENYLWAYLMLSTYPSDQNTGNLLYLEQRIQHLSREIYHIPGKQGEGGISVHIPTSVLLQGYEKLFQADLFSVDCKKCMDSCKNEEQEQCPLLMEESFSAETILKTYHCYHYVRYMNEPIHYHLQPQEILILKELQTMLQRYVSKRGVIVEVNPSSNIIIGHMDTIHEHPLYQVSSYQCDYKDIMLCINSDDPGVFQTNTANELGITYMGMVEREIGREACLEWIERLRESGMRASFIRRTDSDEELLKELDALIEIL